MYLFYIVFILLLCALITSVLLQSKEHEEWLWVKIIGIYLCNFVYLGISIIKIPILIMIVYFVIKKKSKSNVNIKLLALTFSLILFISVNYLVPQASLEQVYNFGKQLAQENRFEQIDYSCYYPQDSKIQSKLRRYNVDNLEVMFSVWVYDHNDIPIRDYEWIKYESQVELDTYWQVSNKKDYTEVYLRLNKTGQEYVGIFKKDIYNKNYLETVIEGNLNQNGLPRSIFDM